MKSLPTSCKGRIDVGNGKSKISMPGRGLPVGVGTGATTRQKLDPPSGLGADPLSTRGLVSTPARNLERLALGSDSLKDSREWGKGLPGSGRGETGVGAVPGDRGRLHSAPTTRHLAALAGVLLAIEAVLPQIPLDRRLDLAVAACQINHIIKGGAL